VTQNYEHPRKIALANLNMISGARRYSSTDDNPAHGISAAKAIQLAAAKYIPPIF
jgi:hypothetical protein